MTHEIILPLFISFIVTAIICPLLIPLLHKIKFGQQVRDDGPQTHLKKQGTPTMGGIAFIIGIMAASVLFAFKYTRMWPIIGMTFWYGAIGFMDDYLKVVKKNTKGLSAWKKMLMQLVLMSALCAYMMIFSDTRTVIHVPFFDVDWDLKWFYPFFTLFVVLGTDNGVNFTDGLDGLCSSVTIVVAIFLTAASVKLGANIAPVCAAVIGGLLAFLLFNAYPAKVFMGDTGSLALGGFVASSFVVLGEPLLILVVGFIYFAEIMSSIIQVAYFKKTHGKRIFKMAPIHHHFELCGWSETRIVTVFTVITVLLALVGWMGL